MSFELKFVDYPTSTAEFAAAYTGATGPVADTSSLQPLDADLTAIAELTGTSGLLKKTAADTWTLDTAPYTTNTGTVTSVGVSVPTGLSVTGSPVTTDGTIAISYSAGYSIPTDVAQGAWDAHTSSTSNPHATTASQVGADPAGTAAAAVAAHAAALDPHPTYTTAAEASAAAPVQSVAGKTGAVVLAKADVGLDNVDNTTDAAKPISTATQTALNGKASLTGVGTSGTWPISITGNAASAPWAGISDKPAVIAEGTTQAEARAAIGAGTSDLALGTTSGTALAGDTAVLPEAPSDGKTYGRKDEGWIEASATPGDNNVGYLNIPQNSQSAAYTCVLADAGKHIFHPSADTTARTFTIPANSSVAYPIGTTITFINQNGAGVLTIAITADTMRLVGAGTTGSRTLAANGAATAIKIAATEWVIYGFMEKSLTWTARDSARNWVSVASSSDGTKLVAAVDGGQLYTSTDSGVSWTAVDSNRTWRGVASSSDGTKLVAAVSAGQLYTSTDSGVSWTARDSSRTWFGVASSSDGTKLVAGVQNGQLYTSTDSGVSWTARDSVRSWLGVASSSDGTKLVAGGSSDQLYTSTDSGVSWTAKGPSGYWYGAASSSDGTKLVAATYSGRIYTGVYA